MCKWFPAKVGFYTIACRAVDDSGRLNEKMKALTSSGMVTYGQSRKRWGSLGPKTPRCT